MAGYNNPANLQNGPVLSQITQAMVNTLINGGAATSITVNQNNHGFVVGQCLIFYNGAYALAGTLAAIADVVGIVSSVASSNQFVLTNSGLVTTLSNLIPGNVYFLSANGTLSATQITTPGQVDKPLLIAISATSGFFNIERGVVIPYTQTPLPYQMGRNKLINGDMQIAQRGAGGTASFSISPNTTAYTFDRWQVSPGSSSTAQVSQSAGTNSGSFWAAIGRPNNNTGTSPIRFGQTLTRSTCLDFPNQTLTLSFKAYAYTGFSGTNQAINVRIYAGTGNTDISGQSNTLTNQVTLLAQNFTLTQSTQSFNATSIQVPVNATQVYVEFAYTPNGTANNDTFYLTDVQLEIGQAASNYDRLPFETSLTRCMPYFQKSYEYPVALKTATQAGGIFCTYTVGGSVAQGAYYGFYTYPVPFYKTPTVNTYGGSTGALNASTSAANNAENANGATPIQINTKNFSVYNNLGSTFNPTVQGNYFHFSADGELY